MQFPESWLRSMVSPALDSNGLGHLLTMSGLEVEEQKNLGGAFSGVVVGQIVSTTPHPDADRLKVCLVDVGQPECLQIVCGAPNAAAGMRVPCALVGAKLGPDFQIKQAKLRGVDSSGMLCSAKELGLSSDHGGLLPLADDAPLGQPLQQYLQLNDEVFEIKLTPNRADCLSLSGIAREVAALTGAPLTLPVITQMAAMHQQERNIILAAGAACPRYCGRIISGINAKISTPEWMRLRLERCGVRSIGIIVDITNYIMLELGQPMHAFDNKKLSGAIHVRWPKAGEKFRLLNDQYVTPNDNTLLITDDEKPLALAGIMGGLDSSITLETTDLFLEAAFFSQQAIAGQARKYGFSSDASHRFERGVDFALPMSAIERASELIQSLCGGTLGPITEAVNEAQLPKRAPVALRLARVNCFLGVSVSTEDILRMFTGLGLQPELRGEQCVVTPPSYRFDINIEEDLIEEIARVIGYDNIPANPPRGILAMPLNDEAKRSPWAVKHQLVERDFHEVVCFSFVEERWEADFCNNHRPIRLSNPIAAPLAVMRSSLIPGLLQTLQTNRSRQHNRIRLFEVGRCFMRGQGSGAEAYDQPLRLAAVAQGNVRPEQWGEAARSVDFYDLKADIEALLAPRQLSFEVCQHPALHPGRAAKIVSENKAIGYLGEIHPQWLDKYDLGSAPIVFELELAAFLERTLPQVAELSRQPFVERDIALVVPQALAVDVVLDCLNKAADDFVQSVTLFDLYEGKGLPEGHKSLAFRIFLRDKSKTLEEAQIEQSVATLVASAGKIGAVLRA